MTSLVDGKRVAVNAGAFGSAEFGADVVVPKKNGIISRLGHLVGMIEAGAIALFGLLARSGNDSRFARARHQQHIEHVSDTGAAQVRVTEAHDRAVGMMVARTPIPTVVVRVGRKLHHAKRHGRAGIGVSVAAGTDGNLDELR